MKRGGLIAIVAALGALALASGAAATRTIDVPSKLSIESNSLHFSGEVTVSSKYAPCAEQRRVTLYKVVSGGPDQAVGHDKTNRHGAWSITPQGSAGITLAHFYAKVKKLRQGTAGTIYVCQAAKSKTIGVTNP